LKLKEETMGGSDRTDLAFWRRRLARRLGRRLATVRALEPGLEERVRRLARRRALRSLGLSEVYAELRDLERRAQQARRALLALVRRVPPGEVGDPGRRGLHPEVRAALRRRTRQHMAELLAGEEAGRQLLGLRRERAELAETLALAAAGRPWKAFWAQALALLGQEPTPLQRLALAPEAGPEAGSGA
jgi:hypothetical protein